MKFKFCYYVLLKALLLFIGISKVNAQRPINDINYQDLLRAQPYCKCSDVIKPEEDPNSIKKLKVVISHQEIKNFINEQCDEWEEGNAAKFPCERGFQLAGFTFIPEWEKTQDGLSETIGLKMALTLWNPQSNEIKFYGFDCMSKTSQRLGHSEESNRLLTMHTLFFLDEAAVNRKRPINIPNRHPISVSSYSDIDSPEKNVDGLKALENSKEFDFVFLSIEKYLELATNPSFYNEGQRSHNGIIIERGISGLEVKEDNSVCNINISDIIIYRTLSFRPNPVPCLSDKAATKAALAYEQGKHCPPYWKDNGSCLSLARSVNNEMHIYRNRKEVIKYLQPTPSISFHLGTDLSSIQSDSSTYSVFYEFDIEYKLGKCWSLEALFGRYETSEYSKIYGQSLMLKRCFPLPSKKELKRASIYLAGGLGAYAFPSDLETGYIFGAGLSFNNAKRLSFEIGGQYQDFSGISNSDNSTNLIGAKAGIKYIIGSYQNERGVFGLRQGQDLFVPEGLSK